jgi:lactoylglutathione lyase
MANTTDSTGIDGLTYVAFQVKDMPKSLNFYQEILGFKYALTLRDNQGKPSAECLQVGNDQFIKLFYADSAAPHIPPKSTNNHICLSVADIHETGRILEEQGIELVIPVRGREGANWQCWCRDPDGNYIEFMYIHPDSFQATS